MASYEEEMLTDEESRVYVNFTDPPGTFPTGWTELEENSEYTSRRRAALGDGQARIHRGNENPVAVNRGGSVDFDLKPRTGVALPAIDAGTIMDLRRINSDGTYEQLHVVVETVEEATPANGMPTWKGTAQRKGPRLTGTVSPWPPVES